MNRRSKLLGAILLVVVVVGALIWFSGPTVIGEGKSRAEGDDGHSSVGFVASVAEQSGRNAKSIQKPRIAASASPEEKTACLQTRGADDPLACIAGASVTPLPECGGVGVAQSGLGCASAELATHWIAKEQGSDQPFPYAPFSALKFSTGGSSRAAAISPSVPAPNPIAPVAHNSVAKLPGDTATVDFVSSDNLAGLPLIDEENQIAPHQVAYTELSEAERTAVDQAHAALYQHDPYPSATKCAACHPGHFREWSVSPHAYAQLSPVFNAMSAKLNMQTSGTLGDFCIRCHTPVGMALEEPMIMSNMDRHPAAREGVTCVVCHRVNKAWGKGSGRIFMVPAGLNGPIYGTLGNAILEEVLQSPEKYGALRTDPASDELGRDIHSLAVPFFQLSTSSFCGACHDVFAPNGFRLEDAFSEYKTSPAALEKHQSCQDCHMGEVPGEPAGYRVAPIAKVGNVETRPRKRTNHMIAGPDHSIIHPGLFPHNPAAVKEEHEAYAHTRGNVPGLATMREWLSFDHEEGWGTPQFERSPAAAELNENGPAPWNNPGMRHRGRQIINDQFTLLGEYNERRRRVLATAFRLGDIEPDRGWGGGLRFRVLIYNGTDGHGVPTGFDAERILFLRTLVWDANGTIVFVSGDLDPNGDVRDSHSIYVHNGELPLDRQLFSLQTRFITRNIRGGEREQVLNVPFSPDPLPYVRPATRPFTVLGRPLGSRKHKKNLEANGGQRMVRYHIKESQLTGCAPYTASVQVVAGMVPINLVHEISDAGFDYGMSPQEIARAVVSGHLVLHERRGVLR